MHIYIYICCVRVVCYRVCLCVCVCVCVFIIIILSHTHFAQNIFQIVFDLPNFSGGTGISACGQRETEGGPPPNQQQQKESWKFFSIDPPCCVCVRVDHHSLFYSCSCLNSSSRIPIWSRSIYSSCVCMWSGLCEFFVFPLFVERQKEE